MTAPVVDIYLTPDHAERSLREDARLGLTSSPKWLAWLEPDNCATGRDRQDRCCLNQRSSSVHASPAAFAL